MLQRDYAALQVSHDQVEEDKLAAEQEIQGVKEEFEQLKEELKKAEEEIKCLNNDKESLSEELRLLQLALEQSEFHLADTRKTAEVAFTIYVNTVVKTGIVCTM